MTTFFGPSRFACATDHKLANPVLIQMNPASCPSAFTGGLAMQVGRCVWCVGLSGLLVCV